MPYTQLTHDDRVSFALLRRMGHSLRSIGRELGKHHTTLGREIRRNQKKNKSGYDARRARQLVHDRRTHAHRRRRKLMNIPWLRCYVIRKLYGQYNRVDRQRQSGARNGRAGRRIGEFCVGSYRGVGRDECNKFDN